MVCTPHTWRHAPAHDGAVQEGISAEPCAVRGADLVVEERVPRLPRHRRQLRLHALGAETTNSGRAFHSKEGERGAVPRARTHFLVRRTSAQGTLLRTWVRARDGMAETDAVMRDSDTPAGRAGLEWEATIWRPLAARLVDHR